MIYDVRVTASPAYEIHAICAKAGIPYTRITESGHTKSSITRSSFVTNRLAYLNSVAILEEHWAGLVASTTSWSVVVRASEEEAAELNFPYSERSHISWILRGLMSEASLIRTLTKVVAVNANRSYLSSVITELYRIQPKEARPFREVFRYLAGESAFLAEDIRPSLALAVKGALPIRRAVKALKKDRSIENKRRIAKLLSIDLFEINYTLAKGSVKKLTLSADERDDANDA